MTITWHDVLAALIGAGLTILGVWASAVADRIRWRRLESIRREASRASQPSASAPVPPAIPAFKRRRKAPVPRSQAKPAPRSEVREGSHRIDPVASWLESMGVSPELAASAARRTDPAAPFEDRVRDALTYTESN